MKVYFREVLLGSNCRWRTLQGQKISDFFLCSNGRMVFINPRDLVDIDQVPEPVAGASATPSSGANISTYESFFGMHKG